MKIGIEGTPFQKSQTGIAKYLLSLLRILIETYPDAEFIIFSNKEVILPDDLKAKIKIIRDNSFFRKLNPTVWLKTIGSYIISKHNLDFYFSCAGLLPYIGSNTKYISVIHDINYKIVPQTMGRLQFLSHYVFLRRDAQKANFVICNSKGTSAKVLQYFEKKTDLIINPPTEKRFTRLSPSETEPILKKHGINYPYFLTVGTLEPRKNLKTTIKVICKLLNNKKLTGFKLVLAGSKGWRNSKIQDLCNKYNNEIIQLGYVDDSDLPALYNEATAFLFPSIYEGFGMPVREAIACGKQVITSDIPELREASNNQGIFINPLDEDQYENAILSVISQSNKTDYLIKNPTESDTKLFLEFFKTSSI